MIDADVLENTPRGTSGKKAPLGRILRNFRFRMRTPKGTPKGSRDLWSLPVAMVLILLYYILYYYYSKKKTRRKIRACAEHTSGYEVTSGYVTRHFR